MKSWFKFRFLALIVLAAIVVCMASFIWSYFSSGREINRILLISIDTCRADYLGCYDSSLQTTPNIDKLSQEGMLFENVISPVPMTLPAHCSILTGTIPPYHGVHDNFDYQLGSFNVTLTELLKEKGFATGAVVSTFIMDSCFGLSQGFDEYEDKIEEEHRPFNIQVNERKGGQSNLLAINWLVEHKNDPFFLFLHYFDPHTPYDPPEPFASKFADNLYAGEIAYTDHCIGQIMEKLKQLELYDSTLIIITGDHGEMLGEHGELDHSYFIYQSALKVPLIIKLPGCSRPKKITGPVGLVDIMPTICSLVDITPPEQVGGMNLSGYFSYQEHLPQERYLYCESMTATKYNANSLLGIVTNGWKYIQTTHPELYDLVEDPKESKNLVAAEPKRALMLKGHLELILEEQLRKDSRSELELDDQARIRLESLGYVSGNVSEDFEFDQSKDDPKDLIGFHNANTNLAHLVSQRRYAEAKLLCEKMLQEKPLFFTGHFTMGRIALEQRDYTTAVSHLSHALELKPADGVTHNNLGVALKEQGKLDKAINHFRKALELQPNSAEVYNNLGLAVRAQGKLDEAIIQFQKALESDMDSAEAHYNLGTSLQLKGKLDEAVEHYLQTIKLQPDFAPAYYNLGVALKSQGKIDKAIRHFVLALKLKPDYAKAHYNLGNVLIMKGQVDAALKHFREAQRLMPNWAAPSQKIESILAARSGTKILDPNQPEK